MDEFLKGLDDTEANTRIKEALNHSKYANMDQLCEHIDDFPRTDVVNKFKQKPFKLDGYFDAALLYGLCCKCK